MESKRIQWNKILNYLVISISLVLVALFLGFCFIPPISSMKASALTKAELTDKDTNNIHFISAKTRIRTASSYNKVRLGGKSNTPFYTYTYNYNSIQSTPLYYSTDMYQPLENYSNVAGGNVLLSNSDNKNQILYSEVKTEDRNYEYIPHRATHFLNGANIEEIFYDEIDNGDFVLLNNYTSHLSSNPYNVENLYLSFGTPYINGYNNETTPITDLTVTASFTDREGTQHNIVLNKFQPIKVTNVDNQKDCMVDYWYQYFDLRELNAYSTNDIGSETYAIKDLQGKYDFHFSFIPYTIDRNNNLVLGDERKTFDYTFYMLDSANYNVIPTISNSTLGSVESNAPNEYFYNFTNDNPTLTYNPETINVNYSRENREITENIVSSYTPGTYLLDGRNYPKGVITYTNNGQEFKQVYILTYYNSDKTLVEYLYLADVNNSFTEKEGTYSEFLSAVNYDLLKFEYKITKILSVDSNKYTTTTYTTTTYDNFPLNLPDRSKDYYDTDNATSEYIKIDSNVYYYSANGSSEEEVATISSSETKELNVPTLKTDGIIINKTTLKTPTEEGNEEKVTPNYFKYKINEDAGKVSIEKTYTDGTTDAGGEYIKYDYTIALNTATNGNYEINDPIDKYIAINYTVTSSEITNLSITRHIYKTEELNTNAKILNKLNYVNQIPLELSYTLAFDNLGRYEFDYSYNVRIGYSIVNNNTTNSTNILDIKDYDFDYDNKTDNLGSEDTTTKDLYIKSSGILDINSKTTLNGVTYAYNSAESTLEINASNRITLVNNSYTIEDPANATLGNLRVPTTYSIDTDAKNNIVLTVSYNIGKIQEKTRIISYTKNKSSIEYVKNTQEIVTRAFTFNNDKNGTPITSVSIPADENWSNLRSLLHFLQTNNTHNIKKDYSSTVNHNSDILHIFGSVAYFNKEDLSTDSEYAKLQKVDSKTKENYISDVTNLYVKNVSSITKYDSSSVPDATTFKGFASTLLAKPNALDINDLIITDITPVFWKNFSTLLYDNKISQSYIFRYNYDVRTNTILGEAETDRYTKDTYAQFDGLYEIVVFYKYDYFKSTTTQDLDENNDEHSENTVFYQLFTFIIDNSSPTLDINVADVNGEYTKDLGLNKYTNKDIQLSWKIPTFFQNDVYIDIEKTEYTASSPTFSATYRQGRILTKYGDSTVTSFGEVKPADKKYNVYITSDRANGIYNVTLHYSANGDSKVTDQFIVDKQQISGLHTLPVIQNNDGTYVTNTQNLNYTKNPTNQIINYDFTFRYNPKESGAKIYTYWYRINLEQANNTEYDQILNVSADKKAITTTSKINGTKLDDFNYGNQYIYNYNTDNIVNNSNYFSSNTSSIYLFKMVDEAGNECRYVVFYDTTTPRFKVEPEIDNANNIVNDSTKITWGDYKAIFIDTDSNYSIPTNITIDNYNKTSYDKFQETLLYINSSDKFNDTKIYYNEVAGKYYFLLPISSVTIEDQSALTTATHKPYINYDSSVPSEYYFFPSNPIDEANKQITVPQYNPVTFKYDDTVLDIESFEYTQMINSDMNAYKRFIDTKNANIHGAFGEGEFYYHVYDRQRNSISGYLWMNLDKTQTIAYGIFNKNIEDPSRAISLGEAKDGLTSSASALYISSLKEINKGNQTQEEIDSSIPSYSLTYKYYKLNTEFYEDLNNNYKLFSIKLLSHADSDPDKLIIAEDQSYLQLNYVHVNDDFIENNISKTIHIEIVDDYGINAPKHSYPYDITGAVLNPDTDGNPEHVYKSHLAYTQAQGDYTRQFSSIINPVADKNGSGNIVTQEGLYIFKRAYLNSPTESELGEDSIVKYQVVYIDRSGIINIATLNSIAEKLYHDGTDEQDFGFVFGSDYAQKDQKSYLDTDDFAGEQNSVNPNSSDSNTHNKTDELFATNKTLLRFNITADKYNFNAFYNTFSSSIKSADSNIQTIIDNYLFSQEYFSQKLYKINLTLKKDLSLTLIDESNMDYASQFNSNAIKDILKDYPTNSTYRSTFYHLFIDGKYNVELKDNSGRVLLDNGVILDKNYQANQLDLSFSIDHKAPTSDAYGKDYSIRLNYDEKTNGSNSTNSIPIIQAGVESTNDMNLKYGLLKKYLEEKKILEPLSLNNKPIINNENGQYVRLYSTNNETLIFTFAITDNEYQAQIDPNNIKIYKDTQLIFNRETVNGEVKYNATNSIVTADRMKDAFIMNEFSDGTKYYAIIIFDNNLDEILDEDEQQYSTFRLLDTNQNNSKATYYVTLNYVGDASNYVVKDNNGTKLSYASTTYEIAIDRIKPTYNLTKLMYLDKYVYNDSKSSIPTPSNYESIFNQYKNYYNFSMDTEYKFEHSDLENYFFALDYRENTAFKFEGNIDPQDSNNGIYIRRVNKDNYKFTITPDDYKAYNTSNYLEGHPLFTSSRAVSINSFSINSPEKMKNVRNQINATTSTYFYLPYTLFSNDGVISANDLAKLLIDDTAASQDNYYYEIIESDEAGNHRVYAVHLPNYQKTKITYNYKRNQTSVVNTGTMTYNSNKDITLNGIEFAFTSYATSDYFVKVYLDIDSTNLKERITIYYSPVDEKIYVKNSKNQNLPAIENVSRSSYIEKFLETINNYILDYNRKITTKGSQYYTMYGYSIKVTFVDRIGAEGSINSTNLYDYVMTFNIAGSILAPEFNNQAQHFTITIPAKTGSTQIVNVKAEIFQGKWKDKDPDDKRNAFSKRPEELLNGFTYTLNKGVYRFTLTDNFDRTNMYFYEFGMSTTQAGGNIKFYDLYKNQNDGYVYTAKYADYIYDNSMYDVFIRYIGDTLDDEISYKETDLIPNIIYSSKQSYIQEDLSAYGISITTIDNLSTIKFEGIVDLSKYHIKAVPASISAQYDYTWNKEAQDDNILVYDKKLAIYKSVPSVIIKNLNGNELDSSEHLHLTEDFEVSLAWKDVKVENQIDFDTKVILTRTYTENNIVKTETLSNSNKYTITKAGEYTAYAINSLNMKSSAITFTRGEGEISMYSVFNIDKNGKKETTLIPSAKVDTEPYETAEETRNIIVFNYFTTLDYFSFVDSVGEKVTTENLNDGEIKEFLIDKNASKYLDVRVNSNLSIFVDYFRLAKEGDTPFAEFRIYSKNNSNEIYTYRFIKVYFVDNTNYNLATTSITTLQDADNIYKGDNPIIERPDKTLIVKFTFIDLETIRYVDGNTIYVDRFFGNDLVETLTFNNITESTQALFNLTNVGLHRFVIRDLAGRQQIFGMENGSTPIKNLQIYLVNQILFTVNDSTPIDNQIFNDSVTIKISPEFAELYNMPTFGISVTKDKYDISTPNSTELTFTEQGSYTVKMVVTTALSDGQTNISDQEITTIYNFRIVKTDVALNTFNVSRGKGFLIEKIIKIVNNERTDITNTYEDAEDLVWLSHETQGNSNFEITLKHFDTNIKDYRMFTFNVWINEDTPVLISNIPDGSSTKEVITLNFNPGMIYSQVGKCKIIINDNVYMEIDENSERVSNSINISSKGTYYIEVVSENGAQLVSYKYTKTDPINKTTQIVLISVAIGAVVLVAVFFLIRRKGKYR